MTEITMSAKILYTQQMIRLFPKIPLYKSFRKTGWPKVLPLNLTLNVTYLCPSRCQTCNIWKKNVLEFTLEEWEKTLKSVGKSPYWLILSGGEPFLRNDLDELCRVAYENCRPKIINIPTNGFLFEIIPGKVEKILAACPDSQLVINLSLDGIREKHDAIRNLKNSFENLLKTYEALRKIKNRRLTVGIHSVISKLNHKDIPEIYEFVKRELNPDSYITEIAEKRVELDNSTLDVFPDSWQYEEAVNFLIGQMEKEKAKGLSKITRALRKNYYALAKEIIQKEEQVLPCYAGFASAQITADGEVWPCCVRGTSMGSLRENNYDFKKIWFGKKAAEVRKSIKNKECHCPLASASYTNMLMDIKFLSRIAGQIIK
jgi:MoaA/NifB/PqqE/SkfB family radical SAM enzyme